MKIINKPKYRSVEDYNKLIEKVINYYSTKDYVVTIKQIGSVSDPGISDLDFLIILKDKYKVTDNIMSILDDYEKYLMIHLPFGISEKYYDDSKKYTLFFLNENKISDIVLKQIALEYLLKLYITLSIQLSIGIIKLRSLLLEIKAIYEDVKLFKDYDMIIKCIIDFLELRKMYYNNHIDFHDVEEMLINLKSILHKFIENNVISNFYINSNHLEAGNISIEKNDKFGLEVTRRSNPFEIIKFNSRMYFNLVNKFYSFKFKIPYESKIIDRELKNKFSYDKNVINYQRNYCPQLLPLRSPFMYGKNI